MSKILAIRSETAAQAALAFKDRSPYAGSIWLSESGIVDYTNVSKEQRQVELKYWRSILPDCRFVLINPDGSGIEEL